MEIIKATIRVQTLFAPVLIVSFLLVQTASAALVPYTDYAAYQMASTGDELIQNFDSLAGGDLVAMLGDVTYSAITPFFETRELRIYSTSDTVSPQNYVGNSNVLDRPFTDQIITVSFGAPRSAVGIFVVTENSAPSIGITADGTQSLTGAVHDTYTNNTQSFFIGLVDDTGANSISSFVLTGSGAGYFFDSQTSFINTIPEPSASLALAGLTVGAIARRRRK